MKKREKKTKEERNACVCISVYKSSFYNQQTGMKTFFLATHHRKEETEIRQFCSISICISILQVRMIIIIIIL